MFIENKTTELKREYVEDVKNTVVAFANCEGGNIYIGITDDGEIIGVSNIDETMLKATNAIRDAIRPDVTMFVECKNEIINEKNVVCISVSKGTSRPYYLHGKGIRPEGVYVRQGASTVPATETAILNMIKETSGDSYEKARSINQNLTFDKTISFFSKRNIQLQQTQMRTLYMIDENGMYTNLAFLLSDQSTHTIKLAVFDGDKKTIFKDRRELCGSLLSQLEETFVFIDLCNKNRAEINGLERIDRRDYPVEAIREALLNAIVHKDYSYSSSTLISIFDDRIEFVTVGGLVKGITLDDVMLGVSMLRNQNLANVFYRLKLIEAYGTGIYKINECYSDYNVKPKIEVTDNAFKITLPNVNFKSKIVNETDNDRSLRDEQVKSLFSSKEYITRNDVETELNVSQATAIKIIRNLLNKGVIIKKGNAKNIRYYLNK